jgi:hypothetical protein
MDVTTARHLSAYKTITPSDDLPREVTSILKFDEDRLNGATTTDTSRHI